MADLIEKDPSLARIVDMKTSRNLLDDPNPLEATLSGGKSGTVVIRLENGPEAPIELAVSADQDWVEPKSAQISLMGGEPGECQVLVHSTGTGEFANICFTWKGHTETYKEYVLVWRKMKVQPATPTEGVWPKPPWMT